MTTKGISKSIETPDLGGIRQVAGSYDASCHRFAIVISRFNTELTHALAEAATSCLQQCGASEENIEVHWVPGAFEIPLVIKDLAAQGGYDALIALGAVVQGETPHAELITTQVTRALSELGLQYNVPVIDGVVATGNMEQAVVRCTTGEQSRGWYAARAAVEMANLRKQS